MSRSCAIKGLSDVKVQIHELDNGIRIFYMPMKGMKLSYIRLATRSGMDAEVTQDLEAAHAIEHMMGDFTSKLHPNAKKMNQKMDMRGIMSNAYTTRGAVWYWMKGMSTFSDWMLSAILATYLQPHMDPNIFTQEMQSIEQELRSDISDTWYSLDTKMHQVLFAGLPSGVSSKKRLANVPNLTLNQLKKLRELWYQPQLIDFYLAGGSTEEASEDS